MKNILIFLSFLLSVTGQNISISESPTMTSSLSPTVSESNEPSTSPTMTSSLSSTVSQSNEPSTSPTMTSSLSSTVSESNPSSESPTMTSSPRISVSSSKSVNSSPSKSLTASLSSLPSYTASSTIVPTQTPTVYQSYSIMTIDVDVVKRSNIPSSLSTNDPNNISLTLAIGLPIIIISLIMIIIAIHRKKFRQIQEPQNIIIVQSPIWGRENPLYGVGVGVIPPQPPTLNV